MADALKETASPEASSVVPGSLVRSSLVWLGSRGRTTHPEIEPLIRALRANHPRSDLSLIERAYTTAARAHQGQKRKSGEPYITHPVAVATILAELGMTEVTLAAALLHDTVEDTDYSLAELEKDFGPDIALLVDGVTKLDKVKYGEATQAETVRKMIVAMSRDIRVLLIKLADRLHNSRTWKYVSVESAKSKAEETLEIFAPLAHRLGLNTIKWELEDRSFMVLYPGVYEEIERLIAERAPAREEYLSQVIASIEDDLRTSKVKGVVTGRPKHHYSIYQKMIVRGREFDDIYDLVAVRVLVETVRDCYAVLGLMHARWTPIQGRFKDYIAMPKFNLYQSLHTTVVGSGGKPVEIQIRTHEMHRRAEYGVAAHWKYKENPNASKAQGGTEVLDSRNEMGWLRQLVDWQRETQDPAEFLDSLRFEMSTQEVYVFTPRGKLIGLPMGSTPVDFAYSVHTEVGDHTIGARVNGKLVPLDSRLENGDTVEIFTTKAMDAGPSRDWLSFVASPKARNKIKAWFSKERREVAIEQGKDAIAKTLRKQNVPIQRLMTHATLSVLAADMGYPDVSGMYAAVGDGHVSAKNVVARLIGSMGGDDGTEETLAEAVTPRLHQQDSTAAATTSGVILQGQDDASLLIKLARCCTPVPGDDIIGFITRGAGVSVHRRDCTNTTHLLSQPERIVEVAWADHSDAAYLVQVQVEALDRGGLLSDITRVLSEHHVNILSGNISTTQDRVAFSRWIFEMAEPSHLQSILAALRRVEGVYSAERSTGANRAIDRDEGDEED
ncbi:MAG: bifunctional (p)ppGpp synthetase/guanosine-3',5'-bis(diphosphate) 3'-pyrophosphohydrolase [Actinomycetaceae bacterium]|nr:bifunctional (p)ppGpp synthetase/guanosine-3',5'-bis(diphosphate) 3'-pyrophosphohydrolase [Actinomycetaceae bacterium]